MYAAYACYQLFSKTTGPNCMTFSGMICHHPRTNRLDFGSDQVKVTKRSKMYFCHNALSFHTIHMKQAPKCSLFNYLSSDMVTNVALARVCTLPSAYSSYLFIGLYVCTHVCMYVTNFSQKLLGRIA